MSASNTTCRFSVDVLTLHAAAGISGCFLILPDCRKSNIPTEEFPINKILRLGISAVISADNLRDRADRREEAAEVQSIVQVEWMIVNAWSTIRERYRECVSWTLTVITELKHITSLLIWYSSRHGTEARGRTRRYSIHSPNRSNTSTSAHSDSAQSTWSYMQELTKAWMISDMRQRLCALYR